MPASDYVINPYAGCTHVCKYCYAKFMKRFTGHREEWEKFIDIKQCEKPINLKKLKGKGCHHIMNNDKLGELRIAVEGENHSRVNSPFYLNKGILPVSLLISFLLPQIAIPI